ncbi:hypothetical protein AB0B10_25165 [Micromonospora arborensis]|uniref:hypothetical protein n=1 Tax=Micromonospora arborensis TaxID=2116518 RepID=UPI0033E696E1
MTTPIENPFWNGGMFTVGPAVDKDTHASLRVLHTLCGQLAASLSGARTDRDRFDNLFALLDDVASGTVGEVGAHGAAWDTTLTDYRLNLARLYANAALDYAWAASSVAHRLAAGEAVAPLRDWPDDVRHPGAPWLAADPAGRLNQVQMPTPAPRLGRWYAGQVTELNQLLGAAHQRMVNAVTQAMKDQAEDLHGDANKPLHRGLEGRGEADQRCTQLEDAATALHTYASACARAVVLLSVTTALGGTGG